MKMLNKEQAIKHQILQLSISYLKHRSIKSLPFEIIKLDKNIWLVDYLIGIESFMVRLTYRDRHYKTYQYPLNLFFNDYNWKL